MPTFTYSELDINGRSSQGRLTAESRTAAMDDLANRGLVPVSIKDLGSPVNSAAPKKQAVRRLGVSAAQVEAFTRELASLLAAGVPLSKGLSILRREASSPAAQEQWTAIHDDVVGGKSLADALAGCGNSFPPVYIAMIRAGELGGFLDVVLNQIADFRARESELKGKVKLALVYPAVLAVLAVIVVVVLLTFFIPSFAKMFSEFGAALPLLTRIILATSNIATSKYMLIVLVFAGAAFLMLQQSLRTPSGRRFLDRTSLKLPGLGMILARFSLVRFSRMLGTLLGAGVSLVTALRVAQEAIGNQTLSDAVADAIEEVKRGSTLSRSLGACSQLFPPSVVEMIAVAEESGRLDKELLRLAQTYEGELDRRLRTLVSLAEPALLFIMAAFIGTIVIGMLLPIFTLQEMIK